MTSMTGMNGTTGTTGTTGMTGTTGTTGTASETAGTGSSTDTITGPPTTDAPTTSTPGNLPPTAKLVNDLVGDRAAPLRVGFSSAGSSDPDGTIAQVHWKFGDGAEADGEATEHVYAEEGSYLLELTVTDDDGASDSLTYELTVSGCPKFSPGVSVGDLASDALVEASGLAFSRRSPGVVWSHNDSEDAPRLYTFTDTGAPLGVYTLQGAEVRDWEDMALGPGPKPNQDYLYVGDIGDNDEKYDQVTVYRAPEPPIDPRKTGVAASLGGVEALEFTFPGGTPRNCETLLVDPVDGDLYLVSKSVDGSSLVFRAPAPLASGVLEAAGQLEFGPGGLTTGGSVTATGDWVVVRTYFAARMWHRTAGTPLHTAFTADGCNVPVAMEIQGEAIGFAATGIDYCTTTEGATPPLYRFSRTSDG